MDPNILAAIKQIWAPVFGAIIVAFFSGNQYRHWTGEEPDKPNNPPRHYTTFARFYLFGFIYVFIFLTGYALLIVSPVWIIDIIKKALPSLGNDFTEVIKSIAGPRTIFAFLMVTTASTKIPVVIKWEKLARKALHDLAKTPSQVRGNINYLKSDYKNKFTISDNDLRSVCNHAELRDYLYAQCFMTVEKDGKKSEINIVDENDDLLNLWIELNHLRNKLDNRTYEHDCMDKCIIQYKQFQSNHDKIKEDVKTYYEVKKDSEDENVLLKRFKGELINKERILLEEILTVICCGIYATRRTKSERNAILNSFGLDDQYVPDPPFNWFNLLKSLGLVFVISFALSCAYGISVRIFRLTPGEETLVKLPSGVLDAFIWSIIVVLLHGSASLIAVFCSRMMSSGTTRIYSNNQELMNQILKVAACSMVFSYIFSFGLLMIFAYLNGSTTSKAIANVWQWGLVPLVTAIYMVRYREYNIANRLSSDIKKIKNQSAIQAFFTWAVAAFAGLLYLKIEFATIQNITPLAIAFLLYISLIALFVGWVLGLRVQTGYLKSLAQQNAADGSSAGGTAREPAAAKA